MTGQIYAACPRDKCFVWTPHTHSEEGTAILVAPVRT